MKRYILILGLLFLAISIPAFSFAANAPDFSLQGEGDNVYSLSDFKGKPLMLFFFSFSCPHCEKVIPVVKELHKQAGGAYTIFGIVYGTPKEDLKYKKIEAGVEFPVAVGTKEVAKDYKVGSTPYFWIVSPDGTLEERLVGDNVVGLLTTSRSSYLIKRGTEDGGKLRVGLFELSSDPKSYEGKTIETEGLLIQISPSYLSKPVFMLTNGGDNIRVISWLPTEASVPAGFDKQRERVTSDFLDKYVAISGKVILEDGKPVIKYYKAAEYFFSEQCRKVRQNILLQV